MSYGTRQEGACLVRFFFVVWSMFVPCPVLARKQVKCERVCAPLRRARSRALLETGLATTPGPWIFAEDL